MTNKLKLTLVKSLIGRNPKHIHIAHQLGLKKINRVSLHADTPAIRGLVNEIAYMLKIEDAGK